ARCRRKSESLETAAAGPTSGLSRTVLLRGRIMAETAYAGAQAPARHRAPSPRADFTISQDWSAYSPEEHDIWRTLFHRQESVLKGRACEEFLAGVRA